MKQSSNVYYSCNTNLNSYTLNPRFKQEKFFQLQDETLTWVEVWYPVWRELYDMRYNNENT